MTQSQINEQIEVLRKVTAEISKSKEATRKFLIDAGILKKKTSTKTPAVAKT